jgi:hypothetical protein
MRGRKRTAVPVVILCIISGLIIWHVIHWHSEGMYLEMFKWLETSRKWITVLYNLGLMLALGTSLSLLLERITYIIGYKKNTKNT